MFAQTDTELLMFINSHHNQFLDFVMWWISDRFIWIPLYAVLLFTFYKTLHHQLWKALLLIAIMILITDQTANFLKLYFEKLRPCHEPSLASVLHLVRNYCGGKFGYASSHAANAVALSTLVILFFKNSYKSLSCIMVIYSLLICYSRIYLAAHYPSDVVRGIVLGLVVGFVFFLLLKRILLKKENAL